MRYLFTPAAERALQAAAAWFSSNDRADLELPELLLGLLDEPECRAAHMLAASGVDIAAVQARWPQLATPAQPAPTGRPVSSDVQNALRAAEQRLWDYPQPLALATEHLLLGILAGESETAGWLRTKGLDADVLEAEIHRLACHERGPLPMPDDDPPGPSPTSPQFATGPVATPSARTSPAAAPVSAELIPQTRILDAAANRASEALRVLEDFARFGLDDRHLTAELKEVRHRLVSVLAAIPTADRLAARETLADVGTTTKTEAEFSRADFASVLTANAQRLQQALRSLEEFTKLSAPELAARLEQLRYQSYTLERALQITHESLGRLATAQLYVLVDAGPNEAAFETLVGALVEAGVPLVQLRDKTLEDRPLLDRARRLRALTRGSQTLFIMNDRPDLAVLADADGVHVGQTELTVKDARTLLGPRRLVGVSTHNLPQARQAVLDGADYVGTGPTFPSQTKAFEDFPGLQLARQVRGEMRLPAFAIGGITLKNLPQVLQAGACRVAVSHAVCGASDPAAQARAFMQLLAEHKP